MGILQKRELIQQVIAAAERDLYEITGSCVRVSVVGVELDGPAIAPEEIINVVEEVLGYKPGAADLKTRKYEIIMLRQIVMLQLKKFYPKMTLKKISELLGGWMDHTTVVHGLAVAADRIACEEEAFVNQLNKAGAGITAWLIREL